MALLVLLACGLTAQTKGSLPDSDQPDAIQIVKSARQQADWVFGINSLTLKQRIKTTRSAAEVRRQLAALRIETWNFRPEQPRVTKLDRDQRPWLQRTNQEFETVIWDRKRYRFHTKSGAHETIIVWDGNEGRRVYKRPDRSGEWYRRPNKPIGDGLWFGYLWTAIGEDWRPPPVFSKPTLKEIESARRKISGRPEDFVYMGVVDFYGRKAHMLRLPRDFPPTWSVKFVDAETGRFCGMRRGRWRTWVDGTWEKLVAEHFESLGMRGSMKELAVRLRWKNADKKELAACWDEFDKKLATVIEANRPADLFPIRDIVLEAEREVSPGCWFPVRERWIEYDPDSHRKVVRSETTRTVFKLQIDEPIKDASLFKLTIPDDAEDVRAIQR
ncbi:MAG: hypothetical protein AB8G99_09035 [Planctomycetaceae bacterium]